MLGVHNSDFLNMIMSPSNVVDFILGEGIFENSYCRQDVNLQTKMVFFDTGDSVYYNGPLVKTTLKIFKRVMQYWQKLHNRLRLEPCSLVIYESGLYYSLVHSHLSVAAVPGAKYIHSDI